MKTLEWNQLEALEGGMSCQQLADQLDWMWAQGGSLALQADAIMYLIADGYTLCDA
mgnify:CR=1 FL=1